MFSTKGFYICKYEGKNRKDPNIPLIIMLKFLQNNWVVKSQENEDEIDISDDGRLVEFCKYLDNLSQEDLEEDTDSCTTYEYTHEIFSARFYSEKGSTIEYFELAGIFEVNRLILDLNQNSMFLFEDNPGIKKKTILQGLEFNFHPLKY